MAMSAKQIILRPITAKQGNEAVKRWHYSGKVVNNSQLHIGVFYNGRIEGAMQFGPSLDKRKMLGLVEGTGWNEFIELNRMAFSDVLPRNSESRAIAIAIKMIRKHLPNIKWVVSFSDGAQCGDGTIYRASGFVLTGIKENNQIWAAPDGEKFSRVGLTDQTSAVQKTKARAIVSRVTMTKGKNAITGGASMKPYIDAGFVPIPGFQLRYIYFIDQSARERLTVPVLPFSEIERRGAGMYKGKPRAGSVDSDTAANQAEKGGAIPTPALQVSIGQKARLDGSDATEIAETKQRRQQKSST
jgi:hypothetical protein